jgi:ubiquinone/menaquinone biosynthesis C-methylase UbiE
MAITVGEEFDVISEVYDSTRQAATEAEIHAVSSELNELHTILDVGVGTGRFAKPLSDLGFEIVGIDLSRKMMSKAKQKGIHDLILADAHCMPFRDEIFDASLIVHVLHLLPNWLGVMKEMGRVTKNKVAALLSNRQGEWPNASNVLGNSGSLINQEFWVRYAKLREEMGYPVKRNRRMWQNETEIRSKVPPMKLVVVSDEVVTTTLGDIIMRFQKRAPCWHQDIPSDIHDKIIQQLFASIENAGNGSKDGTSAIGDRQITRRLMEELAVWQPNQLCSDHV